jgi:hypothetical protein
MPRGRQARDFSDYVEETAPTGVWNAPLQTNEPDRVRESVGAAKRPE